MTVHFPQLFTPKRALTIFYNVFFIYSKTIYLLPIACLYIFLLFCVRFVLLGVVVNSLLDNGKKESDIRNTTQE